MVASIRRSLCLFSKVDAKRGIVFLSEFPCCGTHSESSIHSVNLFTRIESYIFHVRDISYLREKLAINFLHETFHLKESRWLSSKILQTRERYLICRRHFVISLKSKIFCRTLSSVSNDSISTMQYKYTVKKNNKKTPEKQRL